MPLTLLDALLDGLPEGPVGVPSGADPLLRGVLGGGHVGDVLAATVRVTRDLDVAEECVQEAYAQALRTWTGESIPVKPGAWLTTVARRRALDLARRDAAWRRSVPLLVDDPVAPAADEDVVSDDRLRLIFICCHPALPVEARIALTLRLLCGLSTADIARAFLVAEQTMAARITRAKKKITQARIPYATVPGWRCKVHTARAPEPPVLCGHVVA